MERARTESQEPGRERGVDKHQQMLQKYMWVQEVVEHDPVDRESLLWWSCVVFSRVLDEYQELSNVGMDENGGKRKRCVLVTSLFHQLQRVN